jgi:D-amino-acid dehydrogenase
MQNKSTDVLVLGAGIVGLSLALKLQERGREVVLIDRAQAGAATSFGNAGLIERSTVFPYAFPRDFKTLLAYALGRRNAAHYHWRALPSLLPWMWRYWQHSSPVLYPNAIVGALPLIEHSWSEHQPLISAAGVHGLVNERGWIKVFRTHESAKQSRAMAEQSRAYGVTAHTLSPSQLLALEPALKTALLGGVHYPDSRQIQDPQAMSSAYLRLFEQRGGMCAGMGVTRLHRADRIVDQTHAQLVVPVVVIHAGATRPTVDILAVFPDDIRLAHQCVSAALCHLKSPFFRSPMHNSEQLLACPVIPG